MPRHTRKTGRVTDTGRLPQTERGSQCCCCCQLRLCCMLGYGTRRGGKMPSQKKQMGRPPKRPFELIPDTFENVIKALVKPMKLPKARAKTPAD